MKRLTRDWVRKAEADYRGVRLLQNSPEPVHDLVCFHGQQLVEKYLKALLDESGLGVPRTHDLDRLLSLLQATFPSLTKLKRGLHRLRKQARTMAASGRSGEGSVDFNVLERGSRLGSGLTVQAHPFEVEFDGFAQQLNCFIPSFARGNTAG